MGDKSLYESVIKKVAFLMYFRLKIVKIIKNLKKS